MSDDSGLDFYADIVIRVYEYAGSKTDYIVHSFIVMTATLNLNIL